MKTSTRPRDIGGGNIGGRRDGNTLSISDANFHVTEAIGDMYGDDDYNSRRDSRPLSFIPSDPNETNEEANHFINHQSRSSSLRTTNNNPRPQSNVSGHAGNRSHTLPIMSGSRDAPNGNGPPSPVMSIRDHSPLSPNDTAHAQFPLNDVDYESSPAAVAQELSNLQALRRMSMDVGNASDPDLPSFQGVSLMPTVAPTGSDNEDDPSRLFWVPARVHPELAPMEFKTFLENRVNSIKRRSGDLSSHASENIERSGSNASLSTGGGLSRKKSMLSRQIDNSGGRGASGYQDGADRLGRKKSLSAQQSVDLKISDLQELDALVRDPSKAVKSLSLDTSNRMHQAGLDMAEGDEDMPILPAAPGGMALRRSTRTTYRRGSLRKGERVPFSKRAGNRVGTISTDTENEESPISPIGTTSQPGSPLTRVMTEPIPENFSRPSRGARRGATMAESDASPTKSGNVDDIFSKLDNSPTVPSTILSPVIRQNSLPIDTQNSSIQRSESPVPKIVETPPPIEEHSENIRSNLPQQPSYQHQFPARTSSQVASASASHTPPPPKEPPARSSKRPVVVRPDPPSTSPHKANASQTFEQMSQNPSPLPGGNVRTDSLTIIPTLSEDKKTDKKRQEKDDSGSRKTSWGWFKGSDDKEKKKKDENRDDSKKSKLSKAALDKSHENSRLDVLQNSIDGAIVRGRESLLLDRESIDNKLVEERKKESSRKSGEQKKEKDGLFSSIFGGKKKADRDSGPKKGSSLRTLSPEPPRRILKPDVDYPWTRFTILEERAIYRMAHIKLANPKRPLQSQVLLSNFMYAYLAKVQQMHPQAPANVQQKKQMEEERRRKEQEQQYLEQQQQQQQQYDYNSGVSEYAEHDQQAQQQPQSEGVTYVDDSQIYNYDHQNDEVTPRNAADGRPQSRQAQHLNSNGAGPGHGGDQNRQQYQSGGSNEVDDENDDDMW